jgi:hypothetical protein
MNTADYALLTSLLSILISIGALSWNIWQKFIFVRPGLQVSFGLYNVLQQASPGIAKPSGQRVLNMTVTNMGPGAVVLYSCIGKKKERWWTRPQLGLLNPIHGDPLQTQPVSIGPFSAGLPSKIESGDTKSFYFPYTKECFLRDRLCRVGINDTYHRNTWCRASDMRKVNAEYAKNFGLS